MDAIDEKIAKIQEAVIGSIVGHLDKSNLGNMRFAVDKSNGNSCPEKESMLEGTEAACNQKTVPRKHVDANDSIISSVVGDINQHTAYQSDGLPNRVK